MEISEAIKILREEVNETFSYDKAQAYLLAISVLKDQTGQAPSLRRGRWMPVRLGDMRCSLCGKVYGVCGGLLGDYNYCPNCGAKMEE